MKIQIDSRLIQLTEFVHASCKDDVPEKVQGQLFRFGSVLVCGCIERSIEIIIIERLRHRAHERVLNFVRSHFKSGRNFDCKAIQELLGRFDRNWAKKFEVFLKDNPDMSERISSCYSVRNSVAHGGASSMGSKTLREMIEVCHRLVDGVIEATK